ncbi:unnamed protein product, partial [Adineta steineri]
MSVCQYYLRGSCRFGDRCRYPHVINMSVCQHYLRGNCRYGDQCRYPHVKPNVTNPATSAVLKWITENF